MEHKENDLGKYLSSKRKEKGLTLSDVAKMLDLSAGYISRIERGTSNPSKDVLDKLCNIYDIDSLEIMDDEGEIIPENIDIGTNLIEFLSSAKISHKGKPIGVQDRIHLTTISQALLEIEDLEDKNAFVEILNGALRLINKNK